MHSLNYATESKEWGGGGGSKCSWANFLIHAPLAICSFFIQRFALLEVVT